MLKSKIKRLVSLMLLAAGWISGAPAQAGWWYCV
jgi:hypothetical protein